MIEVNEQTFETQILRAKRPMLVDFTAAWCPPCRAQKPVLERFASQRPDIGVALIDSDASPALTSRLGVQALPTLILFVDGEAKAVACGLQSVDRIAALVDRVLTA